MMLLPERAGQILTRSRASHRVVLSFVRDIRHKDRRFLNGSSGRPDSLAPLGEA